MLMEILNLLKVYLIQNFFDFRSHPVSLMLRFARLLCNLTVAFSKDFVGLEKLA